MTEERKMVTTVRQKDDDDDIPWPTGDFTGEWIVEWPNGSIKLRCFFKDGQENGLYECLWKNGITAQKGYFEQGTPKGVWSDYWEDGTLFKETDYFDKNWFDVRLIDDGKVKSVQRFKRYPQDG